MANIWDFKLRWVFFCNGTWLLFFTSGFKFCHCCSSGFDGSIHHEIISQPRLEGPQDQINFFLTISETYLTPCKLQGTLLKFH